MTRLHELAREFGVETHWYYPSDRERDHVVIAIDLLLKVATRGLGLLYSGDDGLWYPMLGKIGMRPYERIEDAVIALAERAREGKT